jgi:transposase InsO family protein
MTQAALPSADQAAEIAPLQRENERLRMERDILRKSNLRRNPDMSFRFIEDHREAYPVRVLCAVLEVSLAGYYAWRSRPPSTRSTANRELVAAIRRVHQDSGGRYGSSCVHAFLRSQGRDIGRGRIERLMRMRRHGICAILAPPRRARTTDSRHALPIAPNLLARDFTAAAPNRIWLADITYAPTGEERALAPGTFSFLIVSFDL